MTPDELKQTHAALDAKNEGHPVQYRNREGKWIDTPYVISVPHRPTPSLEPVPWSLEEHHGGDVWVRLKSQTTKASYSIISWSNESAFVACFGTVDYNSLLNDWEQLDGKPCWRVG